MSNPKTTQDESKESDDSIKDDIVTIDKKKMKDATTEFNARLKQYLGAGNPNFREDKKDNEFEIRFGTNSTSARPLSKIDYDNVVKQLLKHGFTTSLPAGSQYLRINFQKSLTDDKVMDNIRAELVGQTMIQEYCKTNSLQTIVDMPWNNYSKIQFTRKSSTKDADGNWQKPIDMFDMGFRVSYQLEEVFTSGTPFIKPIMSTWADRKKTFRLMNRVRFTHPDYPVFADISIVRSSKKYAKKWGGEGEDGAFAGGAFKRAPTSVAIPKYTIQESGVFDNSETYEIELEIDNSRVGNGMKYKTADDIMNVLRQCIRIILSGIQQCFYPISYTERDVVLNAYMKLIRGEKDYEYKKINMQDKRGFSTNFVFIGPGSITLQREHIQEPKEGSTVVSVLSNYTVTDKADGERKLLFINEEGRIYLIDNRFNVQFTGMKTDEKTIYNSLLDGELVKYDKHGHPLNLYAAFDIYYVNGRSFREKNFFPQESDELPNNYRLPVLQQLISLLKPSSIVGEKPIKIWKEIKDKKGVVSWFHVKSGEISKTRPHIEYSCKLVVQCKRFEAVSEGKTVFECCANIMKDVADGILPYHTDGLIFTPSNTGVGGTSPGSVGPLSSQTWELSLKWKPADQNTVDFLVTVKTDKSGKDEITHVYSDGVNTTAKSAIDQYKTLELMCGYSERNDGFMNPYQDILDGVIPERFQNEGKGKTDYTAALFRPTDPYDANAYITKVKLHDDGVSQLMVSEEGEYFENLTIVEFRYDMSRPNDSRWVPLRVRTDKTQQLRNGENQFGNAFRVANSNWKSIHYPVTEEMITTGKGIPNVIEEGVYYKGNKENHTQGLRDFHNLYVKKALIQGVSSRGDTLIDYAVGMGGDLPKWISSKLGFVFGIDVSFPNIHNNKRGACARYLNMRRDNSSIPSCIFSVGNSALNIRSLKAFPGDTNSKDKMVANAIFGKGPKDASILGKGIMSHFGKGESGFQISSCQFALHYFFENKVAFHGFLRNLAECTRDQGYFIGTCYDGKTIFKMLSKKKESESATFVTNDRSENRVRICEIVKRYNDTGFPADDTSLGYRIDVYQESINQFVSEFLVNFDFFVEMMDNYGFKLITRDEAHQMGLPSPTGLFSELYDAMKSDIRRNRDLEIDYKEAPFMSQVERSVSFLNRYFVFRKVISVDAAKKERLFLKNTSIDEPSTDMTELEDAYEKELRKRPAVRGEIKKTRIRTKLKKPTSELFSQPTIDTKGSTEDVKEMEMEDKDILSESV